jgi:hypothetical protein
MKKYFVTICIQQIIHKREEDIDSIFNEEDEEEDNDIQFGKIYVATKIKPLNHESLAITVCKINCKYYLDVATNFTTIN